MTTITRDSVPLTTKMGGPATFLTPTKGHEDKEQVPSFEKLTITETDSSTTVASELCFEYGESPIALAAKNGDVEHLRTLIQSGSEVNLGISVGQSPLHQAASNGHTLCVELLLANKASVNFTNFMGRTPLHNAASGGHSDCVSALLENGADVNLSDSDSATALHHASVQGHIKCTSLIAAAGAKLDAQDSDNHTAAECVRIRQQNTKDPAEIERYIACRRAIIDASLERDFNELAAKAKQRAIDDGFTCTIKFSASVSLKDLLSADNSRTTDLSADKQV